MFLVFLMLTARLRKVVFMGDSGLNLDILVQINKILHTLLLEMCVVPALYWLKSTYWKRIFPLVDEEIRDMSKARFHHQPSPAPCPL